MSAQVMVTLPDDTYRRVEYLARLMNRDIADILVETIDRSLHPLALHPCSASPSRTSLTSTC